MENMNDIINELVKDIETPEDVPVTYEVWAIGYTEEDEPTGAALVLGTFEDPDQAVSFARDTTLADVVNLAADDECEINYDTQYISIEIETVVSANDDLVESMNVGTVYRKKIELFEELPDFVCLSNDEYEVIEETGNIAVPSQLLSNYNKNDVITVLFEDEEEPWPIEYRIICKTDNYCVCEFV